MPASAFAFELDLSKEQKLVTLNAGAFAAITAWGIMSWDYFEHDPHAQSEGWFSSDTKEGGADKLGHFYASYTLSHALAHTFENWGYSSKKSALYGALSSFSIMNWMELGDSFSHYGFSHEDFIMNSMGTLAGYYLYTHPKLSSIIDFRCEYTPSFTTLDIFTDYNNTKFLMAVKLDGFESVENKYLKYLELHLGYYVRDISINHKERNVYVGIGLNLSKIFSNFSMNRLSTFTRYYQTPYTYVGIDITQ